VGGVRSGRDAVEFLMAGADAVQVGTATFRDPRAPWKVLRQLSAGAPRRGHGGALRAPPGAARMPRRRRRRPVTVPREVETR
jgi:dihydroorotate dehydrogenase (NAD+) catalytic subunit